MGYTVTATLRRSYFVALKAAQRSPLMALDYTLYGDSNQVYVEWPVGRRLDYRRSVRPSH